MKDPKFARPLDLNNVRGSNVPRNAFDMSYHSYFTSPAGLLLPNYVQDVQPGDFLKLDVTSFTPTIVTGKQIGRASCRERVSSPV